MRSRPWLRCSARMLCCHWGCLAKHWCETSLSSKDCDGMISKGRVEQVDDVKYGTYNRYSFNEREYISIQRYRCDNDLCHRKTFSILPHAFLPIVRASLCMFMYVLNIYEQGHSVAEIARLTNSNWPRIQRWITMASKMRQWFQKEYRILLWSPCPCLSVHKFWMPFTRDFSWNFYPDRF